MDALKHLVCPISPTLLPDASKRDIQKKDALLDEAATAHAKRTETVDDAIKVFGKHVRTEFAPEHDRHRQIVFFEDGEHVRTEYAPGHWRHGIIQFYKDGEWVRTEYAPGHEEHGEIRFFEDGEHVRTEYAPGHARHDQIAFFKNYEHVRTEYALGHAKYGKIKFYNNDDGYDDSEHVRTEFAPGHALHGQIIFYKNRVVVRLEFAPGHAKHGEIEVFEVGNVRTEYAPGHARHGEIKKFWDRDRKHFRIEYAPTHANHGEIGFFEDDEHVRTEYAPGHAKHGEIHFYKDAHPIYGGADPPGAVADQAAVRHLADLPSELLRCIFDDSLTDGVCCHGRALADLRLLRLEVRLEEEVRATSNYRKHVRRWYAQQRMRRKLAVERAHDRVNVLERRVFDKESRVRTLSRWPNSKLAESATQLCHELNRHPKLCMSTSRQPGGGEVSLDALRRIIRLTALVGQDACDAVSSRFGADAAAEAAADVPWNATSAVEQHPATEELRLLQNELQAAHDEAATAQAWLAPFEHRVPLFRRQARG